MKILISSNGPNVRTGYGVQCALLATRLAAAGHEVAVACSFGQQVGMGVWRTPLGHDIPLYWMGQTATSDDILLAHALHWFQGDPTAGWIFLFTDVWAIRPDVARDFHNFNVAAWAPVDHLNMPPQVFGFFEVSQVLPLAMSQHGEKQMIELGLEPTYLPLALDPGFKPTFNVTTAGGPMPGRDYYEIPRNAFVVGMVAMNKGWVFDRKGFSEAFYAFGLFHRLHPNSILYLHSEPEGFDGINLKALASSAGIPDGAIIWSNHWAYRCGFSTEMMAGLYTSFDVLLAPSHGEGFCVPMLEAQACGTPVIASNATAQAELCGAGWLVDGQPQWDQSQRCPGFLPSIKDIVTKLEEAYNADLVGLQAQAIEFAQQYEADRVFDTYWVPFLKTLEPQIPDADKPPMDRVAVVVPAMRPHCVAPFMEAFDRCNDGTATAYFVADPDNTDLIEAIRASTAELLISDRGHTFAQKANVGYKKTTEDFIFVTGEDTEVTEGWLKAPRDLSTRWDVIGTNDTDGKPRNLDVAAKRHADHWFTRRTYIDEEGACLEGPGEFCPEAYYHWWVDREVIMLARAKGVFAPCLDSVVIHHHPGYRGDEAARQADPVYMAAVEWADRDKIKFLQRVPLIEQQRLARGRA